MALVLNGKKDGTLELYKIERENSEKHEENPFTKTIKALGARRAYMSLPGKFDWVKDIEFDSQKPYLLLKGKERYDVIDFSDPHQPKYLQKYSIEENEIYDVILDARIETRDCCTKNAGQFYGKAKSKKNLAIHDQHEHDNEFMMVVACKRKVGS